MRAGAFVRGLVIVLLGVSASGCASTGGRGRDGVDSGTGCPLGLQDHDHDGVCRLACSVAVCNGHGQCRDDTGRTVCTCTGGYLGDACDHCPDGMQDNDDNAVCLAACAPTTCSGHGNCTDASGHVECACTGGYAGIACGACSPGLQDNDRNGICSGACSASACSGRGACSDATGSPVCTCTGGYTGATCATCAARMQDNDHDGMCAPVCTADSCSGHGLCGDATGSAVCTCDAPFTGSDCSACPAGMQDRDRDGTCSPACASATCTGHGTCEDTSGTATCACIGGYAGLSCVACAPGTQDNDHDGVCTAACGASSCNGHGACSDSTGVVRCVCTGNYAGDRCAECAPGAQDRDHDGMCSAGCADEYACSHHGACDDATGAAVCTCTGGYTGVACDVCAAGSQDVDRDGVCNPSCAPTTCSGHGACDESSGTATCTCTGNYTGVACDVCGTGLQDHDRDGTCTADCTLVTCSGYGTCDDASGTAVCTCAPGHTGSDCGNCGAGLQDRDHNGVCLPSCAAATCNRHGTCSDASGTALCACSGAYVGATCATCGPGLQDNDHDGACTAACTSSTCSGHGTCADATGTAVCTCAGNHAAIDCSVCADGYQDNDRNGSCAPSCSDGACNGHGACADASGATVCTCRGNYSGPTCASCATGLQDNDRDGVCSAICTTTTCGGHGTCSDASGTTACTCDAGHSGTDCSGCAYGLQDRDNNGSCTPACTGATCGGHGACVDATGTTVCTCAGGYTGATCASCAAGTQDNDHDGVCSPACTASTCTGGKTCSDAGGTAACACPSGMQDNDGNAVCAPACTATTCAAHQTCADATGATVCACAAGYTGATCAMCATGFQDNDHDGTCTHACNQTECSNNGYCVDSTGTATCSCGVPYGGSACDQVCMQQRPWVSCTVAHGLCSFPDEVSSGSIQGSGYFYGCSFQPTPTYCDLTTASCMPSGCVNLVLGYDLGSNVAVSRVRLTTLTRSQGLTNWAVWVGATAAATPGNGAVMVGSATISGQPKCVDLTRPCTREVPDICCSRGRATNQFFQFFSGDQGLWSDATFASMTGRYWFITATSTSSPSFFGIQWLQFWDDQCP